MGNVRNWLYLLVAALPALAILSPGAGQLASAQEQPATLTIAPAPGAIAAGSRATFTLGRFGGHDGRVLVDGDTLSCSGAGTAERAPRRILSDEQPALSNDWQLAVTMARTARRSTSPTPTSTICWARPTRCISTPTAPVSG